MFDYLQQVYPVSITIFPVTGKILQLKPSFHHMISTLTEESLASFIFNIIYLTKVDNRFLPLIGSGIRFKVHSILFFSFSKAG